MNYNSKLQHSKSKPYTSLVFLITNFLSRLILSNYVVAIKYVGFISTVHRA